MVRLHILQTLASLVNAGGPPVAACIVGFTSRMISWCVEDGKGDDRVCRQFLLLLIYR